MLAYISKHLKESGHCKFFQNFLFLQVECYSVDADNRVKSEDLTLVIPSTAGINKEGPDDSGFPQNLTTFKLSLGEQEKQARSQLVLPYLKYVVLSVQI
jgi:hypothetical protein